jgi:hypothetical protein
MIAAISGTSSAQKGRKTTLSLIRTGLVEKSVVGWLGVTGRFLLINWGPGNCVVRHYLSGTRAGQRPTFGRSRRPLFISSNEDPSPHHPRPPFRVTEWSGASPVPQGGVSPAGRGTTTGRASRRASREMPEVSARLFDINGPVSVFTVSRT